jgi:hypothetical protein
LRFIRPGIGNSNTLRLVHRLHGLQNLKTDGLLLIQIRNWICRYLGPVKREAASPQDNGEAQQTGADKFHRSAFKDATLPLRNVRKDSSRRV